MITSDIPRLREAIGSAAPVPDTSRSGGPAVDPRLVTTYSPRVSWPQPQGEDLPRDEFWGHGSRLAGPWPEAAAPGLVIGGNSDTQAVRNGWQGITPLARRSIHRACASLEDQRSRLAFWTVTLSPAQLDWIERYDSWPAFQSAIRHRLVRTLRSRGLRPLVVGVIELHPERSTKEGRPCPHIHVAFVGRQHRKARWALSTADLDLIICKALIAAQCFDLDVRAAGNVQPVRQSVGAYLSHYLKKGSGPPAGAGRGYQLIPRQWFFQSRALLAMVRTLTVLLPLPFVAFIHGRWSALREQGWGEWQQVEIADARAPAVFSILWQSVESVAAAIAWWQETAWDDRWYSLHPVASRRLGG